VLYTGREIVHDRTELGQKWATAVDEAERLSKRKENRLRRGGSEEV
jgi:hypothetical protein